MRFAACFDSSLHTAPPPTSLLIAPILAPKSEGGCRLTGILVAASKADGAPFSSEDVQLACVLSCVYGMAVQVHSARLLRLPFLNLVLLR